MIAAAIGMVACATASRAATPDGPNFGGLVTPFKIGALVQKPPFAPTEQVVDFADLFGKKPVLVFYWLPESEESKTELKTFSRWCAKRRNLACYAATRVKGDEDLPKIRAALETLGVAIPTLLDRDFKVALSFGIDTVPRYSLVDRAGKLRVINVSALDEPMDVKGTTIAELADKTRSGVRIKTSYGEGRRDNPFSMVGKPAPDFSLKSVDGKPAKSLKDCASKRTLIVFWRYDCPHCRKELPKISAYYKKHQSDVEVLAVTSCGDAKRLQATQKYIAEEKFAFAGINDAEHKVMEAYRITGFPTMVLVDGNGVIRDVKIGEMKEFDKSMDRALSKLRAD